MLFIEQGKDGFLGLTDFGEHEVGFGVRPPDSQTERQQFKPLIMNELKIKTVDWISE